MFIKTALVALIVTFAFSGVAGAKGGHKRAPGTNKAVAACQAERTANPTAFTTKYANSNGKHAMRRCVARHLKAARATCKAEHTADATAFKTKYGKHARKACIRAHAGDPVA